MLSGPIPLELANLTNLNELRFSNNNLSGVVPPMLCKHLESYEINVKNNKLCPPYPDCVSYDAGSQDTSNCLKTVVSHSLSPNAHFGG